jgi:hypothetical protein
MIKTITIECSLGDLMDVLNATGNPKVATDILNGYYKAPSYPEVIIGEFRTKKDKVRVNDVEEEIDTYVPVMYTAVSYNPFTDIIKYLYENSYGHMREEEMTLSTWLKRYEKNYQLGA